MVDVLSTRLQAIYNPWERIAQGDNRLSPFVRKQVLQKRKEREQARIRGHVAAAQVFTYTSIPAEVMAFLPRISLSQYFFPNYRNSVKMSEIRTSMKKLRI